MRIPDHLTERSFAEWNYLLRGIVEMWEVARGLDEQDELEERLAEDADGTAADAMGRAGNELLTLGASMGRMALTHSPERALRHTGGALERFRETSLAAALEDPQRSQPSRSSIRAEVTVSASASA